MCTDRTYLLSVSRIFFPGLLEPSDCHSVVRGTVDLCFSLNHDPDFTKRFDFLYKSQDDFQLSKVIRTSPPRTIFVCVHCTQSVRQNGFSICSSTVEGEIN